MTYSTIDNKTYECLNSFFSKINIHTQQDRDNFEQRFNKINNKENVDLSIIVSTNDCCSGRQRIKGTRLSVEDVVSAICLGHEEEKYLLSDYDYLTSLDVDACLIYAHKNNMLIDVFDE